MKRNRLLAVFFINPIRYILSSMQTRYRLLPLCLIALTVVIYYPFLNSPFVFDDFYNLFALEQVNQNGYLSFLAEGFSGPTGRPVSLFSFHDRFLLPGWIDIILQKQGLNVSLQI